MNELNERRGVGEASRFPFQIEKLEELGWTVKRRNSLSKGKVFFSYTSPEGKTLKSTKEVVEQLKIDGVFESVCENPPATNSDKETTEETTSTSFEQRLPILRFRISRLYLGVRCARLQRARNLTWVRG